MILISAHGLGRQYSGDPIFQDLAFEVSRGRAHRACRTQRRGQDDLDPASGAVGRT